MNLSLKKRLELLEGYTHSTAKTYSAAEAESWQEQIQQLAQENHNYYYLDSQIVLDRCKEEYKRPSSSNECRVLYRTLAELLTGNYPSKRSFLVRYHDIIHPVLKESKKNGIKIVVLIDKAHLLAPDNLYVLAADAKYFNESGRALVQNGSSFEYKALVDAFFVLSGQDDLLAQKLESATGIGHYLQRISKWE